MKMWQNDWQQDCIREAIMWLCRAGIEKDPLERLMCLASASEAIERAEEYGDALP